MLCLLLSHHPIWNLFHGQTSSSSTGLTHLFPLSWPFSNHITVLSVLGRKCFATVEASQWDHMEPGQLRGKMCFGQTLVMVFFFVCGAWWVDSWQLIRSRIQQQFIYIPTYICMCIHIYYFDASLLEWNIWYNILSLSLLSSCPALLKLLGQVNDMIQLWGAEFIKGHADYGEIFTEWRLWEAARACYNFFHKKYKMLPELVSTMGDLCDFLHPRLHSTIVLQNIQFVTNALCTTLYDGITESDLKMLIMELTKLCVCWLNYVYGFWLSSVVVTFMCSVFEFLL